MQITLPIKRPHFRRLRAQCRRWAIPSVMFLAALPVYAQTGASPWENAVNALKTSFTGPIAQGLSLVAIVVGCGSPKCHPGGKSAVDGPRMPTKALRHVSRSASWHTSTFICLHFFAEYQNTELGGQIIAVMEATELWHG
jgi:hypothetical protein